MKRNYTYILIAVAILGCAVVYWYEVSQQANVKRTFIADINVISSDVGVLQGMDNFGSIRDEGKGWFHINGDDANFEEGVFYTAKGDMGNGNSASLEEFTKSVSLTQDQLHALVSIMQKYPYLYEISNDPNMSGTCTLPTESTGAYCHALKFYPHRNLLSGGVKAGGYLYASFNLDDQDNAYIQKHFTEIAPVGKYWYEFSGEK